MNIGSSSEMTCGYRSAAAFQAENMASSDGLRAATSFRSCGSESSVDDSGTELSGAISDGIESGFVAPPFAFGSAGGDKPSGLAAWAGFQQNAAANVAK